ncbi:MAG: DUF4870 domain-containing protein [Oscillospiraceae bacterium]
MNDLNNLNNTPDSTANFDPKDIEENKVMALLSYIGFLFLVPMLAKKESPYAQFHAKQGANLFILEIIVSVVFFILGLILGGIPVIGTIISIISWLASLCLGILAILGIVNAVTGKAKELPLIGSIKIIK